MAEKKTSPDVRKDPEITGKEKPKHLPGIPKIMTEPETKGGHRGEHPNKAKTNKPGPEYFTVLRNDPNDLYKQNSEMEVIKLNETGKNQYQIVSERDLDVLQKVAEDIDLSMSLERVEPAQNIEHSYITPVVETELDRLPSWLKSMVLKKLPFIHAMYQKNTPLFLRTLANRIQFKFNTKARYRDAGSTNFATRGSEAERDYRDFFRVFNSAKQEEDQLAALSASRQANNEIAAANVTESTIAIRVAFADERWRAWSISKEKNESAVGKVTNDKNRTYVRLQSHPHMRILSQKESVQLAEANVKLRSALQVRASYGQVQNQVEDEELLKLHQRTMDSDEEEAYKESYKYMADKYWNEIFDQKYIHGIANKNAEEYFKNKTREKTKERKGCKCRRTKQHPKKQRIRKGTISKAEIRMKKFAQKKRERFFVSKNWKRTKKRAFLEHGYFQQEGRLFRSSCGTVRKQPVRRDRTYRCDESFHTYCIAVVTWFWFKVIIMCIIGLNAIVLAIEAGPIGDKHPYQFHVYDAIFVAIYTVEFILKIYAHPYLYWKSGFNIFDFIILVLALANHILNWLDLADGELLRALMIVRVLRILRCISLSVQLQVLVSALVETIKTHVLSVVLLLILLLYVTAIVAFYLFGARYPQAFGTIGRGMLNMLRVLTIDGWTDLNMELQNVVGIAGVFFMIICIVLGNFLFSNIFVAIIIMNISEATDNFRDKQREERETIVRQKKEKFFHRQKLDLRLLYFTQKEESFKDFYALSAAFQNLLRHDDLVDKLDTITSPLWVDNVYQMALNAKKTSTMLMNLHRELSDNLLEIYRENKESRLNIKPIGRTTYNRYLQVKAKLGIIKREILRSKTIGTKAQTIGKLG